MIRRLFYELLLFLLPFMLYALYWHLIGQQAAKEPKRGHPMTVLFAAGLVLVAASFVWWGLSGGAPAGGVYVPPRTENGEIVPGRVEPAPPQ